MATRKVIGVPLSLVQEWHHRVNMFALPLLFAGILTAIWVVTLHENNKDEKKSTRDQIMRFSSYFVLGATILQAYLFMYGSKQFDSHVRSNLWWLC